MKKILFLLVLLASQSAIGSDWIALPGTGGDQYFYDNSKLVIKDDEITYWKKVIFKAAQNIKGKEATSGILRERIHCGEHTAKLMSYLYYSAAGEPIEFMSQEDALATPIIPDTVGDVFDQKLCPFVWRKQEETRIKAEQLTTDAELKKSATEEESKKKSVTPTAKPTQPRPPNIRLPEKNIGLPQLPPPQIIPPQIMEQLY